MSVVSMMEQAHTGKCHSNTVFVAAFDNEIVTDRSAGLCDILNTASLCSFDIVVEREESIGTEGYTVNIRLTVKGSLKTHTESYLVHVILYDGRWAVISHSI